MTLVAKAVLLLVASNVFMTFAWYYHLGEDMKRKPLYFAILVSWGIAFFEYILQVPANRFGDSAGLKLAQLKILQEVITLVVFVPFAVFMMGQKPRLDFLWAALCLCGAVYFVFRTDPSSAAQSTQHDTTAAHAKQRVEQHPTP